MIQNFEVDKSTKYIRNLIRLRFFRIAYVFIVFRYLFCHFYGFNSQKCKMKNLKIQLFLSCSMLFQYFEKAQKNMLRF